MLRLTQSRNQQNVIYKITIESIKILNIETFIL
jgi:hypothetical protein